MKAVGIEHHGGPEVLQVTERPEPKAGPGEVVVDVRPGGRIIAPSAAGAGTRV